MKSSYDKRVVLSDVISSGSLTIDMKQGVLVTAAGVQSDYDRAQMLSAYVRSTVSSQLSASRSLRR